MAIGALQVPWATRIRTAYSAPRLGTPSSSSEPSKQFVECIVQGVHNNIQQMTALAFLPCGVDHVYRSRHNSLIGVSVIGRFRIEVVWCLNF